MRQSIHVWHLELTARTPRTAPATPRGYDLRRASNPTPELGRFMYLSVGAPWTWYMRLRWTWAQWKHRYAEANVEFWVAYDGAVPIGYFELEHQLLGGTEICYFGLIPEYIGRGIGKDFLEDAIERAWQVGGSRVWLHTCSLDHPNALANYRRRGFTVFREEDVVDDLPDEPIQPWEGANKP